MRLYRRNEITAAIAGAALEGTGKKVLVEFEGADEKTAFIVTATAEDTLIVHAGAGSVNKNNLSLTVPSGTSVFTLDSAFFMGADGKVAFEGKNTTKVATVVLP
jgi:hypothetical protein